ncbi:MAG: TolC family protein [Verrucomicrobiota bacterium]
MRNYISLNLILVTSSLLLASTEAQTAPRIKISPKSLVAQALENNMGLEVSRLEVGIADDTVDSEWGRFSPTLGFEVGIDKVYRRQNAEEPSTSLFAPPQELFEGQRSFLSTSLGGRLPFGTTYEFTAASNRNDSDFTDNATFDPEYSSSVGLTVTQPLLKNFGLNVGLAPVNIAKSDKSVAEHETKGAIEAIMARVLLACYEVYFADENVIVKEESIELARNLLEDNQKRVDQGRGSPIDVTQAEARIAEAEAELVEAQSFFNERQARLRELTQVSYQFGGDDYTFDSIETLLPLPEKIEKANMYAGEMLSNNADYLAAIANAETEGIRVVFTKNQRYPELNLRLSVGTSGLEDDLGSSYNDFENRRGIDWGVGVVFSMPLDNRTANAQYRASQKRERQAILRAKDTEIQLLSALDVAVDNLTAGIKRKRLINEQVRLAEEALSAEETRLANGVTTNYEVLIQQRELSVSQTQALAAEVETYKAYLQLLLLQGILAENLGFELSFTPNSES